MSMSMYWSLGLVQASALPRSFTHSPSTHLCCHVFLTLPACLAYLSALSVIFRVIWLAVDA
jgi:hypothetical protein